MLTIGKRAVFGADGLAVRGQCLSHTTGWRLRWFAGGAETVLREGTLPECRRAMAAAKGADNVDAARMAVEKWSQGKWRAPGGVLSPTDVYPAVSGDEDSRAKPRRRRKRGR